MGFGAVGALKGPNRYEFNQNKLFVGSDGGLNSIT